MDVTTAKSRLILCEEKCVERCESLGKGSELFIHCVDECIKECAEYQEAGPYIRRKRE